MSTEEDLLPPSKSQLKREAHAQQALGQRLTELPASKLAKLPLPDAVRNAIEEYKRLPNSHGARRRQMQFLGKLMRGIDFEELSTAVDNLANQQAGRSDSKPDAAWLDRIVTEGETAIEALVHQHPDADRQQLRQLYRNLVRAPDDSKGRMESRLRRYLQTLFATQ